MHVLMFLIVVAVVTGALLIVSAPSKAPKRAVSDYYDHDMNVSHLDRMDGAGVERAQR
jgi:hypothetical protein